MPDPAIIALDAMGGDFGPEVVLPAAVQVIKKHKNVGIILVGDEAILRARAEQIGMDLTGALAGRIEIQHASQVVEMCDEPALAIRKKKDSSMRVAIDLVKEGRAQAAVSAGNTGALMGTAKFVLKTVPGIDRPAICTTIPSVTGHTHMLDLGANVDCSGENLCQFAIMGSVLAEAVDNVERPRVGLLNIGSEAMKGNALVKEADALLVNAPINYIGFVEGDDIYNGSVDVVVCDGFVGNVSLKTSEGVAKMISHFMKEEFSKGLYNKIAAMIAMPVLKAFKKRIDPRAYNGASMLGLNGIVIKSHGGTDIFGFANAIEIAVLEVEKTVPQHIRSRMEPLLEKAV
ncbi:MAG: phosphate acyltransferase PlsX [Gammaproteobacteria bacterium]|nr:phosphate acyltransferase PlsX [Gammaproteobacteria bacterium]